MSRRRKKKESAFKTVFLILMAVMVMAAAIFIVVKVFGKISSDYKSLDFTKQEVTTDIDIEINEEQSLGWDETDKGWKYFISEDSFISSQWKEIEGFLYYFDDEGILATGEWKREGQVFTCDDTKGYLKDIQVDWGYVPEATGENLDSLVRTNAFWCFLQQEETSSPFKTIQYRKSVENKIMVLGREDKPEKTTKNSMRAYGDYVYFLPKVKDSQVQLLTGDERELCNKLFRMRPGAQTKELIADNVDGYLIIDDTIYFSQNGKLASAVSGEEYVSGDDRYSVVIKGDDCYLIDEKGNAVASENGDSVNIGDRVYTIEADGKIKSVEPGRIEVDGIAYYISRSDTKAHITAKTDKGEQSLIKEKLGIQSFCIVDHYIYYSSFVDKDNVRGWYSQIFRTNLEGKEKEELSERFPGVMENMYYYEGEGTILGEYYPAVWKQGYGTVAVIDRNGDIYKLNDISARDGKETIGNDMLEIVMAKDGKVICLWQNYEWIEDIGSTRVLWSKAVELDASSRSLIDKEPDESAKETTAPKETTEIIQPIGSYPSTVPVETVPPSAPPVINDPVISTEGPKRENTAPVPTVPPVTETQPEIEIIPLG